MSNIIASDNLCGECNFCCQNLWISQRQSYDGNDKPAGQLCSAYDDGCSIYQTRPTICSQYTCYWLERKLAGDPLPDQWQPNQVGFTISRRTDSVMLIDSIIDISETHPVLIHLQQYEGDIRMVLNKV